MLADTLGSSPALKLLELGYNPIGPEGEFECGALVPELQVSACDIMHRYPPPQWIDWFERNERMFLHVRARTASI